MGDLRSEIRSEFKEIHAEIQTVRNVALVNSAKIDAYRDAMTIWFTVLAIVVALVGIMATFASTFREMYKDYKQAKNHVVLREAARKVLREELPDAVRNFLGDSNVIGK